MSFPHTHELRRMFSRTSFYMQSITVCFAFVIAMESCSLPSNQMSLLENSSFLTYFPLVQFQQCNFFTLCVPAYSHFTKNAVTTLSLREIVPVCFANLFQRNPSPFVQVISCLSCLKKCVPCFVQWSKLCGQPIPQSAHRAFSRTPICSAVERIRGNNLRH